LDYWYLTPLSTILQFFHVGHVLLVEETGVPRENHWPIKFYHLKLYGVHLMDGNSTHNCRGDRQWLLTLILYQTTIQAQSRQPLSKQHECFWSRFCTYSMEFYRLSQVTDKLYHIMLFSSSWAEVEPTTSVVIGNNCIGSCKSNHHTITSMTAPYYQLLEYVRFVNMHINIL
jgi:hypothetical protein